MDSRRVGRLSVLANSGQIVFPALKRIDGANKLVYNADAHAVAILQARHHY